MYVNLYANLFLHETFRCKEKEKNKRTTREKGLDDPTAVRCRLEERVPLQIRLTMQAHEHETLLLRQVGVARQSLL